MKILMLGWELPPYNSGGLGVACWQLCRELSKKSVSIKFIVPYQADHGSDFMDIASLADHHPSAMWGVYDNPAHTSNPDASQPSSIFELEKQYAKNIDQFLDEQYQVIHAHDWLTFRAGIRASNVTGKKLIVHVHSVESDRAGNNPGNPLVHELEELGLKNADHIVAVSQFTKQKIINEYAIPADKITVAHNSIAGDHIIPFDDDNVYGYLQTLKDNGYKIVCSVGRLTIQKGIANLLRAAAKVLASEPKTMFLIVGSGDQEHELIRLSAELGIGKNVLFVGFQRGKKWRDAFAIADLFVMPSVSEPFGLTPLEASAYHTASLVSYQSGVTEVLRNCLKVDCWDVDSMANSIASVVRHSTLSAELSRNAYQEFERLNWSDSADKLLRLYRQHSEAPKVLA